MKRFRIVLIALFAVTTLAVLELGATAAPAPTTRTAAPVPTVKTMNRQEIRATPLLERPSRPGHFYGNAVRRRN
jgi:hypothetical protein